MTFLTITGLPVTDMIYRHYPHERLAMTEEVVTRTRKKNPLVEYEKARVFADRARKAHDRAHDLATKAYAALEKANDLAALKDTAEVAEADALAALEDHLESLRNPLVEPDGEDFEDGDE